VLEHALGQQADGSWSAPEVALVVPRQCGKSLVLAVRELFGLFVLGERLIFHSAHEFTTSLESFRLLLELIDADDELSGQVKRVSNSHGDEGLELIDGRRIRFRTRTRGGGRGFSADCVVYDEAQMLAETSQAAMLPTLSARPNSQTIYSGTAVDQRSHEHGLVLARGVQPKANITRRFRRALKAAGLDESHVFHDLRHTFGTRMTAGGVPLRSLQEWLGHRDLATTQIYADYSPSDREAEMVATAFADQTAVPTPAADCRI
jgi:hypothetical protein